MSPLPKKKKTPEELAALRESLGISSEGPPANAPGVMGHGPIGPPEPQPAEIAPEPAPIPEVKKEVAKAPVIEAEPQAEPEIRPEQPVVLETEEAPEAKVKVVMSLRKSERLPVDKPKRVSSRNDGKIPTRKHREGERIPLEKPTEPISATATQLPTRKHSDQELARLRHAPLPGVEAPAVHLANQTAGLVSLLVIYGIGVILMVVAGLGAMAGRASAFDLPFDWLKDAVSLPNFSMILFGVMTAGVAVMLLGAAWVYFKKPISQYHAAIMTIIAVLVLVFGTLYFFPGLHGA